MEVNPNPTSISTHWEVGRLDNVEPSPLNDVAVITPLVAIAEAPFGGIKQAGYGREGGSMAIKDYLNVKYTHLGLKG